MNRILFESSEIADGVATCSDARAEHILSVLHGEVGQMLKTGEIDGRIGTGEIVSIEGQNISIRVSHTEESLQPWCDLVLAPPRPRVMKRLLPQLATLGVGTIVLVGAKKVEKDFWGATLLKEEIYRPLLVEGLMQCGTTVLPELLVRRNFRRFLDEELDALFPNSDRIVAHPSPTPHEPRTTNHESRITSHEPRPLLAIGPEGGWTDNEVELLEAHGFRRFSLGPRILRTDTAAVALIAVIGAN